MAQPPEEQADCLFCKGFRLVETDAVVTTSPALTVLMDKFPLTDYHVLLAPRIHIPDFFQLPDDVLGHITLAARDIAQVLRAVSRRPKIALFWAGQEIEGHAHMHLMPLSNGLKRLFAGPNEKPRIEASLTTLREQAATVSAALGVVLGTSQ